MEDKIEVRDGWWWPKDDKEGWEWIPYEHTFFHQLVRWVGGRDTVVQAGANCGIWIRSYAQEFKNVYTFEPDDINFECLKRNITDPNVVMQKAALGDKVGHCHTVENIKGNMGAQRIQLGGDVPVVRIDDLPLETCDLIQLDVEGYEHQAVLGALETIKKFKPVVILELCGHGQKYGFSDQNTIEMMESLGYRMAQKVISDLIFIPKES